MTPPQPPQRRSTATSNFGVSARESHDSSAFYERFRPPTVSDDDTVLPPDDLADPFFCGDARSMDGVPDGSVALVVTSPPYFAGKQYEEELERDGIPATYLEYLDMLRDVFAECARTLEPGGRIAVNVANLGRKPYRSLSSDIIGILERDLGLLLRGELIWQKGEGASGSCAWGSFRSASNPVLRDLTERVVVASKGRFDRARTVRQREAEGLPHRNTIMAEDFMSLTLDLWSIPPESARRVGHPAPFPVELPEQLIRLYTFEDDLVLDPFMGSGSAMVAAARLGRRFAGYDLDPAYVELARQRVAEARDVTDTRKVPGPSGPLRRRSNKSGKHGEPATLALFAQVPDTVRVPDDGRAAGKLAERVLADAGFTVGATDKAIRKTAVRVIEATDADGDVWHFDVAGPHLARRGGLQRTEVVWRTLGRAAAVRGRIGDDTPLVVLTTALPRQPSEGDTALRAAGPRTLFDVVDVRSSDGRDRLARYAKGGHTVAPVAGFWSAADLDRRV